LYQSLGIYLPLITTNCAVLGLAVLTVQKGYSFLEGIVFAIGAALGFTLALVLFAGLRERWISPRCRRVFAARPSPWSPPGCSRWRSWASPGWSRVA